MDKHLNLCCGHNVITNMINIDMVSFDGIDLVLDIRNNKLPYEDNSISSVLLSHAIEHIEKCYHAGIFIEINRVLKESGIFIISFPEFFECVHQLETAIGNKTEFFEKTIFGRQNGPGDYHVCVVTTNYIHNLLKTYCFDTIEKSVEADEPYNTVMKARKLITVQTREDLFRSEVCQPV